MSETQSPLRSSVLACGAACSILLSVLPRTARAQEVVIPRIEGAIVLDGHPAEPVWETVPPLPLTMFEPEFAAPITRTSTIRVAHDGEYLYAAGVFRDDGPVRATSMIRDYDGEDDVFNLVIDSFDDDETAFWFAVTPRGTRLDGAVTDNTEGASWNHPEFDNIWDAAAVITEEGWSGEIRIPLSSLRFQAKEGVVRMGLIAGRKIARVRERHTFPAIRPGPNFAQFKPSLAADVVLAGVETARPVEVRPYGLGGLSRINETGTPREDDAVHEIGGDLKLGIGPRLTLDVTLNTDFAQTEADDERLNLTRFDLFYPEKRRFFLERSGIFDFSDGENHRLFYSRTIGLGPTGAPERIYAGGRLVGRLGGWDIGLMDMQTEVAGGGSMNNAVVRVRRKLLNSSSYVGAIATAVAGSGVPGTGAIGLDGAINPRGSHFFTFSAAASQDSAGDPGATVRLAVEERDRRGFAYRAGASYTDDNYRPPLGFVRRRGVSALDALLSYGRFGESGRLQEQILSVGGEVLRRHVDGEIETATGRVRWDGTRRGGGEAYWEVRANHEDLANAFGLSEDAHVPAGRYSFIDGVVSIGLPAGWTRRATLEVSGGQYYDGRRFSAAVRPTWNVSPHLELAGDLETNRIALPARDQHFRGDIARVRFRAAVNPQLSAYGLVQYNSAHGRAAANFRLRYNFREGRDLYVVWNEGMQRVSDGPGSGEWDSTRRNLLVKYSHAMWW